MRCSKSALARLSAATALDRQRQRRGVIGPASRQPRPLPLQAPPQTLLLASADMRWIASGAEAAAARRVSSAIGAAWIELGAAVAAVAPRHRASFDDAATRWAVGAAGRLVVQKHEGVCGSCWRSSEAPGGAPAG